MGSKRTTFAARASLQAGVAKPRFLADRNLGKLARQLRMLGYDTDWTPGEVLSAEGRTVLTRDRRLARERGAFLVTAQYPFHQARHVIRAFGLDDSEAFTRCVEDNGPMVPVERSELADRLPPDGAKGPFFRCSVCGRIYWSGSHVERMRQTILDLLDAPVPDDGHAPEEEAGSGRLEPLLDLHQALDAMFWAHRVAVLQGRIPEALTALRRFAMHLVRHIDEEDALVLPLYAESPPAGGFPRGGAPDIFRRDHERLRESLTRLELASEALLERADGEARDLARLALLDEERKFVDLLAHHDHRERAYLYPRLAELTTAAEQEVLLERMIPGVDFAP